MLKKNKIIQEEEIDFPKFDEKVGSELETLCDRVKCRLKLTLNSHKELAQFKQSLLTEKLPPNVLIALSLISGEILKNGIDLDNLLNQLIKIVEKNSFQLQEHMPKFMKLGDDYKRKCGQLDVALRRLELENEDFKRVQQKETLQNWELLFTRAQLAQSHGRRWKYRMFEFKEKAKKGADCLHEYFKELLDEDDGIKKVVKVESQTVNETIDITIKSREKTKSSLEEHDKELTRDNEELEEEDEEYQESFEDKDDTESLEPIEMRDMAVGTSDKDYKEKLVLRIYNPKGIGMFGDLICKIFYGSKIYKTDCLDKSELAKKEEKEIENDLDNSAVEAKPILKGKGGLIGKKKTKQPDVPVKSKEEIKKLEEEKKLRELRRNETITIEIPEQITSGLSRGNIFESIKINLLTLLSPDEIFGECTIDIDELRNMELPIYNDPVYRGDMITPSSTPTDDKFSIPFPSLTPMDFPVYSYQNDSSTGDRVQIGHLPMACYWTHLEKVTKFNRIAETCTINELIEDMTGIDLSKTSKEDLIKEKVDKSESPRPITPPPETMLKSEFDEMIKNQRETFERLLLEKNAEITELENKTIESSKFGESVSRPPSVYHKDCAVSPIFPYRSVPGSRRPNSTEYSSSASIDKEKSYQPIRRSAKSRDTLSTSGVDEQEEIIFSSIPDQNLIEKKNERPIRKHSRTRPSNPLLSQPIPDDFVQRVSVYSELSVKHQEELRDKVRNEVAGAIEMKLSELYRLHDELTEDEVSVALADMSLPAVFMPFTNSSGTIYNPRAHQYFHPLGLKYLRLSQPPSIMKLPPIKESQMSILNLFDVGNELKVKSLSSEAFTQKDLNNFKHVFGYSIIPES